MPRFSPRRDGRTEANLETGSPSVLGARWLKREAPSITSGLSRGGGLNEYQCGSGASFERDTRNHLLSHLTSWPLLLSVR